MRKRIGVILLLGAVAAGAVWMQRGMAVAQPGLLPYRDAGAVERGRVIYADQCAACHGAGLEGEANWRSRDADGYLPAPPHDSSGHTWHHPDRQLIALTWYGPARLIGDGYQSRMPGFAGVLSEAEVLDVLAYIKSTWPDRIIARHDAMNEAAEAE